MRLDWLADVLRNAGLDVIELDGWETRTNKPFDQFRPVGLLNHHTAGSSILTDYPNPPDWPDDRLSKVCNLTIRGSGTVVVLNAGYAYDSGNGDRLVLNAVLNDRPAPPPTDTYVDGHPGGPNPGMSMNPYYIDIEVQHLGNGDLINPPQREALITANRAICERMEWNPEFRLLGHRESTKRKVDPRWDGFANPMPQIRIDTMEDEMPLTPEDLNAIRNIVNEQLVKVLGGDRITMPKLDADEKQRYGNQGIVNAVWWATGGGNQLFRVLIEARNAAEKAAAASTVDAEAIAQQTADELAVRLGN